MGKDLPVAPGWLLQVSWATRTLRTNLSLYPRSCVILSTQVARGNICESLCTHALTLWMIDDDDGGSVYCSLGGVGPDRGLWGGGRRGWREEWARRLGRSYFFISLVLGPLNSLVWYVPSLRYTRGLGWRIHCGVEVTESSYDSSTNKQHISIETYSFHRRTIIHALHFDYDLQTQAQAQRRIAEADCR